MTNIFYKSIWHDTMYTLSGSAINTSAATRLPPHHASRCQENAGKIITIRMLVLTPKESEYRSADDLLWWHRPIEPEKPFVQHS